MPIKRIEAVAVWLMVVFLGGCASLPPPPAPENNNAAILGARVNIKAPLFSNQTPANVYFIRVDHADSSPRRGELIAANYKIQNIYYILNAKPGYYMLSYGNFATSMRNKYTVPLNERDVMASKTAIRRGEVVFMGDIDIDTSLDKDKSDDFQQFLLGQLGIDPASISASVLSRFNPFSQTVNQFVWYGIATEIEKTPETQQAFFDLSRKGFKQTAWQGRFTTK